MDFNTFLLILFAIAIITLCSITTWWFGGMLLPIFGGGAPFVPTRQKIIQTMFMLADLNAQDVCTDLGSGDGRLVIGACQHGAKRAMGYEIHPGLVYTARRMIKNAGLDKRARIYRKTMWKADLHDTTVVFIYQLPFVMKRIHKKLVDELPHGARIVSNAFAIPGWEPARQDGNVFLYIKP